MLEELKTKSAELNKEIFESDQYLEAVETIKKREVELEDYKKKQAHASAEVGQMEAVKKVMQNQLDETDLEKIK